MLYTFGRYVDIGIKILVDRCLITVTNSSIQVHDLLQQMGQRIVLEESMKPGERSRLWLTEDICRVLKHNTGTEAIQGISLETRELRDIIHLNPRVFKRMYNLKYLKFSIYEDKKYLYFPKGLKFLPDALRYLFWNDYPLKFLPLNFKPQNLVELHLRDSKLEHLWNGEQNFANLKVLDLFGSKHLIQIPDLSRALNLEKIEISICERLENLPSGIGKLDLLQSLHMSLCPNIKKFPELPMNIKYLSMSETSIEEVPSSIERLIHLNTFDLRDCKMLKSLPTSIWKLKFLRRLLLNGCLRIENLQESLERFTDFDLNGACIRKSPFSVENPVKVNTSGLNYCQNLQLIPDNIYNMRLTDLNLSDCLKLKNLPPLSIGLLFLESLNLSRTSISEIPDEFFRYLPVLHNLSLCGTGIRTIPSSIKMSKLRQLHITNCESLEFLPELPISMKLVDASGCTSLQMVSNASTEIQSLSVSNTATASKEEFWSYECYYREELRFCDCLKLDHNNIITEFQIRALRLRFLPRPKGIEFPLRFGDLDVFISFPGDEIQEWFNYQNENGGSLLNMKLPQHFHDSTNFMGFASCVVVAPELNGESTNSNVCIHYFTLKCDVKVKTNRGQRCFNFETNFCDFTNDSSNHVLMWYFRRDEINLFAAKEISFDFYTVVEGSSTNRSFEDVYPTSPFTFKVKRCGIRMLRLQDAVKYGIIKSESVQREPNVKANELEPSGLEIVDLEANEPPPKRSKFLSLR